MMTPCSSLEPLNALYSGTFIQTDFLWLMQTVELHVAQGIYDPYSMDGESFAETKDVLLPGSVTC